MGGQMDQSGVPFYLVEELSGASAGPAPLQVTRCEFTSHVCIAMEYHRRKIYDIAHQELDRLRSRMVSIAS